MNTNTNNAENTEAAGDQAAVAAVVFHAVFMPISKTVGDKRVFSHNLAYGLPTLDMIPGADLASPDKWENQQKDTAEDAQPLLVPVYDNEILEYMQGALNQRIQGLARSRDKANQEPVMSWEALAECGGGSKFPVQLKQFREDLLAWLKSEEGGASEAQQLALMAYTDSKVLTSQPEAKKAKVAEWFNKFFESYGDKASEIGSVTAGIKRAMTTNIDDVEL